MTKEPRFLDVKEIKDGYFTIRKVYVPVNYNDTFLRKPYDPIILQHIQNAINTVNKIENQSDRKEQLRTQLEALLG